MEYIIVSDIFGKTAHLSHFARQFNAKSIIVNPYDGQLQPVIDEQLQYDLFITECGHDNYFNKLNTILSRVTKPTTVIGFSAGGAAAWRSQATVKNSQIKRLVAFYPNQVRHYLDLSASVACEFIFAKQEVHFDILPVLACLEQQIKVQCQRADYGHGFMNPLSKGFDSFGYQQYSQYLLTENN